MCGPSTIHLSLILEIFKWLSLHGDWLIDICMYWWLDWYRYS